MKFPHLDPKYLLETGKALIKNKHEDDEPGVILKDQNSPTLHSETRGRKTMLAAKTHGSSFPCQAAETGNGSAETTETGKQSRPGNLLGC